MPDSQPDAATAVSDLPARIGQRVTLRGWLLGRRDSRGLAFLVLRDGTGFVQVVVSQQAVDASTWADVEAATQESALEIVGEVRADERQEGGVEVAAEGVRLISLAEPYPITPKSHGVEFLADHRHLWLRSRRQWAIMRVRNRVVWSIHSFFQERGYLQLDAPILTGNAVEGTSTLFELDYFGQPAYLTQSGQLHGEALAMAFGKVYTFGPTFRAEKSKTRRHLTEFWMIEPEIAFCDLDENMAVAEAVLLRIVGDVLAECTRELEVLGRDRSALERVKPGFPRLSYSDAVDLLRSAESRRLLDEEEQALHDEQAALDAERETNHQAYAGAAKGEKRRIDAREIEINTRIERIAETLKNVPEWRASAEGFEWGGDFGGSDETVLTKHFDTPIIVHRFPQEVKAFYMKRDPEDDRLALGMDVLAPEGYGEIVGGGERATDLDFLKSQIAAHGLPESVFEWYLDLRRFGSVPHSGFGLGLERTVAWVCGLPHIREAAPFPRLIGRLNP